MKEIFFVPILMIIILLGLMESNNNNIEKCHLYLEKGMTLNEVKEKHGEGKFYNTCKKIYEENTGTGKVEANKVIKEENIINEKSGSGQDDIVEGVIENVSGTGNINE